jgi:hypothetical protein
VSASGTAVVGRADTVAAAEPASSTVDTAADPADVDVTGPGPNPGVTPPPAAPAAVVVDAGQATSLAEAVARPVPDPAGVGVGAATPSTTGTTVAAVAAVDVAAPDPVVVFARDAVAAAAAVLVAAAGPGVRLNPGLVTAWLTLVAADAIAIVPASRGSITEDRPAAPTMTPVRPPHGASITADPVPAAPTIGAVIRAAMTPAPRARRPG